MMTSMAQQVTVALPQGTLETLTTNSPFTASAKVQGAVAADGLEVAAGGAGSVVLADLDINKLAITKQGCAYSPTSKGSRSASLQSSAPHPCIKYGLDRQIC